MLNPPNSLADVRELDRSDPLRTMRERFVMPDGNERFLVDEEYLANATAELGGRLLDPLKTTVVHGARSMTTWVVGKA